MENKEAKELLIKYRAGNCSDEEVALVETWYLEYQDNALDFDLEELAAVRDKVWAGLPVHKKQSRYFKLWPPLAAAASLVICVAIGLLFIYNKPQKEADHSKIVKILPGGNKAILTLADGSRIDLDDIANGRLAKQSGTLINKAADGQLIYTLSEVKENDASEFNTVETPRGGQYQVNLPDGTKVWLNAASSLKFPTTFAANERKVVLTGEGYFEVSPNKASPFKVVSGNQTITVLGTHFNVSAYKDDDYTATTLLEGKVSVQLAATDVSTVLRPGEQSRLKDKSFKTEFVNTENEIAWVSNSFVFDNEELGSIMRKISRWYNVDVICPPSMENMEFSGTGSRNKSIQDILRIMEFTESVHFKFEGRRVTVMP